MARETTTGPARCFSMIRNSVGRAMRCREPVTWHGALASAKRGAYRVFSCDLHADLLVDRSPITKRVRAADTTTDRVTLLK
jgi:hypothetical protein